MDLWTRVHQVARTALTMGCTVVLVALAGESAVPAPSLVRGALIGTPIALALPLAAAAVLIRAATAGPAVLEDVAVRPARLYGAVLVAAACGGVLAAGVVLTWGGLQPLGFAAARNLLGLTGLALIGNRAHGRAAATVLPTAYLFLTLMVRHGAGPMPPWLWPLADSSDVAAAVTAAVAFACGLVLHLRARHRPGGD
ncbi:hypothetical protein [Actinomadura roseirufa]|uniref:hypothetical protein n=1 Tax=Actinomadura roseirufa TaxID=2094049 RepID=UPI0010414A9D|nr:hypothetical protein [Actinomadura roseirufa]